MQYIKTRKDPIVDHYFGHQVADPYRWLEDDRSEDTAEWVAGQNSVTFDYLGQIGFRQQLREQIAASQDYEKSSQPFVHGEYTYFYKNDGLQNQSVLYRRKGQEPEQVFLDPNGFSEDGTTSLSGVFFSKDDSLVAYTISEGGSDWRKIFVIDAETGEQIEPEIVDAKFTGVSWLGNQGFYYSRYDKPQGSELSARNRTTQALFSPIGHATIR